MTRTVPPQLTEVPGNFITSALWNTQINNGLYSFTFTPPFFKGTSSTPGSFASGPSLAVPLTSAIADTDGGWSSVTNPSRYTVQVAGKYLVVGSIAWTVTSSTGLALGVELRQNGATTRTNESSSFTGGTWRGQVTDIMQCSAGDYIELAGFQGSGSAQTPVTSPTKDMPTLICIWQGN